LTIDFAEYILSDIDTKNNGLYRIFSTKTKGGLINAQNMTTSLGQCLYIKKRAPFTFSFRRTSPYFCRCDIDPRSRGFIPNSFIDGLNSWELFYTAMEARIDLLKKSFLISESGE